VASSPESIWFKLLTIEMNYHWGEKPWELDGGERRWQKKEKKRGEKKKEKKKGRSQANLNQGEPLQRAVVVANHLFIIRGFLRALRVDIGISWLVKLPGTLLNIQ